MVRSSNPQNDLVALKEYIKKEYKNKGKKVYAFKISGIVLETLKAVDDRVEEGDTLYYEPEKDRFYSSHLVKNYEE